MIKQQLNSFKNALHGLKCAYKSEAHLRFHCFIALLVLIFGALFRLSAGEWIACSLCIGSVITAELINTAIEAAIDLATNDLHPLAKKAKDVAAGAVLVCAIMSVLIGIIIFLPKVLQCLTLMCQS